ncbi:PREDICTED: uncharacterized protein LOC104709609 [Camelina sativa]|uniref:Uncharacterized protein LOC104709609 n=1 Tax=Camelina sativa TaxID=90675 RepID=A0ABM1QC23_CAMSA|nr:PREDICTED: uncharacterized protein LOC104709609 [Camelina sativa]
MASKQITISPYVNINEINPALDHYKIRVRVIRLWKAFKSLQMVLVDREGTRIHASIEDALVKKFHNQINVGESKIIDTFSLVDYDGDYRTSALGFKIVFYRTTTIKPYDDFPARVPENYFQEFSTILAGKIDKRVLFDVVGQIAGVGSLDNVKTKGKDNVKISFDLQDLRLPNTSVVDLVQNEDEAKNTQPKLTLYEEFFMKNEKKTIDEILYSFEVRTCVTIGTIRSVEIVPKWYYIACKECRKKVQAYPLESDKGKNVYIVVVFAMTMSKKLITSISSYYTFRMELLQRLSCFFYGLAQIFVGKKADDLVSQIAEDDLSILPVSLSALIGKTMLFKISITNDNLKSDKASYVVEKFWEKEDMVNQFVKETYGKVNDNHQELEPAEQILQLTSEETTSFSSKRELSGLNEEVVRGHNMTTRKEDQD